jgi:MerR family copper efflux transcriptional regulator
MTDEGGASAQPAATASGTTRSGLLQIGQVAERTGLSLRSIRWYEQEGLVGPTTRTGGGFRLYSEHDIARLVVITQMKPLGFSLDEMRQLLTLLDDLDAGGQDRAALLERLRMFHEAATARVRALEEQQRVAEAFAGTLASRLDSTP